MKQKNFFSLLFLILISLFLLLPVILPFNDIMTKVVERNRWYGFMQEWLVPLEVRMVGCFVIPLGIKFEPYQSGALIEGRYAGMTWNCLGWQSLMLFVITAIIAFKAGSFTLISKLETFLIGIISVFIINLLRITFTVILLAKSRPIFKIFFHDYLSAITTVVFLFFFWWFSYRFILTEKEEIREIKNNAKTDIK